MRELSMKELYMRINILNSTIPFFSKNPDVTKIWVNIKMLLAPFNGPIFSPKMTPPIFQYATKWPSWPIYPMITIFVLIK